MMIGILGSGQVAQALANGFLRYGHEVMLGTRSEGKLAEWRRQSGGRVGSMEEAARFGEIVVLAVKGTVAETAVKAVAEHLQGKTVIDATNPIADEPPVNGVLRFFTGPNDSLMERLQALSSRANFVKAFSCIGNAFMVQPQFKDGTPTMFICGDSDAAKKQVTEILRQFGWEWADMGKAEAARAIEPLCILWCIPGLTSNSWAHAFKLIRN